MKIISIKVPDRLFGMESSMLIMLSPVVLMVVVMLVTINLLVMPKIDDLTAANTQIDKLNKEALLLDQKRNYLLSVDQDELNKNSDFISSALLPQRNAYLLLGVVRRIMDNYGYQIESFKISPGDLEANQNADPKLKKVQDVYKIPIDIEVAGSNSKYKELVLGLERSLPILSLDSFEMTNKSELSKIKMKISASYIDDSVKVNVEKLTLADLSLQKEESDLILELGKYTMIEKVDELKLDMQKQFVRYERNDPFSL